MAMLAVKLGYDTVFGIARKNENVSNLIRTQGSDLRFPLNPFKNLQVLEITKGTLCKGPIYTPLKSAYKCSKTHQNVSIAVGKIGVFPKVRTKPDLHSLSLINFQNQFEFSARSGRGYGQTIY